MREQADGGRSVDEEIVHRYLNGQSMRAVAEALDVSVAKVENTLADRGIGQQEGYGRSRIGDRRPLPLTPQEIAQRYVSGQRMKDLAEEIGATAATIRRRLKDQGIEIHPYLPPRVDGRPRDPQVDEKTILDLYRSGGSLRSVAEQTETTVGVVRGVLERHGIERRPTGGVSGVRALTKKQQASVVKKYQAGVSEFALTQEFNVSKAVIRNVLRDHSVPRRSHQEARAQRFTNASQVPLESLVRGYQAGETMAELARRYSVDVRTIKRRLQAAGVLPADPAES